ncbi:MAG: hypothetical protein DRI46_14070 [Chloroflexi bacterium]|nr:MAG: hypothetical protein DRI46_14070 [Chloroflexota bacterium]
MIFIAPEVYKNKFTCPHCGAIALQRWDHRGLDFGNYGDDRHNRIKVAKCDHCDDCTLWLDKKMLYPDIGEAPQPNPDLAETVKDIYLEAASISSKSPRGAAALLRLAVQVLCAELGEDGRNINSDISALVQKGLPERVQQALDIVRVTGNNAVHPGQIDVDDPDIVSNLFELINVIAEYTISMPNRIGSLYGTLPDDALEQISERDNNV